MVFVVTKSIALDILISDLLIEYLNGLFLSLS